MQSSSYRSRRILLPVRSGFIFLTFLLALLFDALPLGHFYFMPDMVMLVLSIWCIREPLRVGMGSAFILGVLVDISQGSAMGQHALAYVLLAFVCHLTSRRLAWFSAPLQALHIAPLFFAAQLIMLTVRMIAGGQFPGFGYFLESVSTVVLWVPLYYILLIPQMRPISRDENRPL